MILQEYVKNNPDDTFFIGSKTAYFFIGNAEQFEKDIDDIDTKYKTGFKNSIHTAQVKLTNLIAEGEPQGDVMREYLDHFGRLKRRKIPHAQAVIDYYSQIKRLEKMISNFTDYVGNYIPIAEREITDVSKKECLEDGFRIIVDGLEEGRFWLKEEYETGYVEVPVGDDGLAKKKVKVK